MVHATAVRLSLGLALVAAVAPIQVFADVPAPTPAVAARHDGAHDFDFEIGTWKTHLRRLAHPLSGSDAWVEYDGVTLVRKVWDGRPTWWSSRSRGPAARSRR